MASDSDFNGSVSRFIAHVEIVSRKCPGSGNTVGVARAPAIVDVMGGIGEDSGALVLTATLAPSYHVAAWRTGDDRVRVCFTSEESDGAPREIDLPLSEVAGADEAAAAILDRCRQAPWAVTSLLTVHRALARGVLPGLDGGLCLVVHTDFPEAADLGRRSAQAAATIDAVCKLFGREPDRLSQGHVCADAIMQETGLYHLRRSMTALCARSERALLQLRFHPNVLCEQLEMPEDVIIQAVATRLTRPTTLQRLIETRTCSEMGHRMIMDLQRQDGVTIDPNSNRLSSVTPAEFVERFRDRMPSKITRDAFVGRFGAIRGLDGNDANPKGVYKIRSRAEHHIYENRRVHDFATSMVRARRSRGNAALVAAGELMYASHWSHSQRCGIGGVETDRLVTLIRGQGPDAGLFGAKVTAGGEGGELVVLMRGDERAHAALADAVSKAESASQRAVHVFGGSLPGAVSFQAPDLSGMVSSVSPV